MTLFPISQSEPEDIFKFLGADPPSIPEEQPLTVRDSFKAYELACQTSAVFSPEDLAISGTWQKYERRAAALARAHHKRDPFAKFLERLRMNDWPTRNSRQADRSALVRLASRDILQFAPIYWKEKLTKLERDTGTYKAFVEAIERFHSADVCTQIENANAPLSEEDRHQFKIAVHFLLQVPPDPFHTKLSQHQSLIDKQADPKTSRKGHRSVKNTLTALNQHARRKMNARPDYDWRNHFWMTTLRDSYIDDHRRAFIAALMLTGCRPAEFSEELGVDLLLQSRPEGSTCLSITIAGAKTMQPMTGELAGKGQNFRSIKFNCAAPEGQWLMDALNLAEQPRMRLTLPSPSLSESGAHLPTTERHRRISASLGKLVTRIGKAAFPRLRHNVTPYVFRHAFAADMKTAGHFDSEMIAQALGHQSTRTQESYGLVSGTRGLSTARAQQVINVTATSPIRYPDRDNHMNGSICNGKI
ncbi:site-specific integrase [Neptunicoccus sediminis]|uniref:site-specific integrase n=1 Tax=Neptunicoccus sediminis TaxID=1892596 RepID=UPI0008461A6F|nr:site-specific integrase [Neptunicoccus sediminis]